MHRTLTALVFVAVLCVPTAASANDSLELEAQMSTMGGILGRVGFQLDPHAVALVGLSAWHFQQEVGDTGYGLQSTTDVTVPLELKFYFAAPRAGAIAPMIRAGIFLRWRGTEYTDTTLDVTSAGASLSGGAAWFANEAVGLEIELGARGSRAVDVAMGGPEEDSNHYQETTIDVGVRAGVVLRL